MKVSHLGERKVIELLEEYFTGIGDDAAVLEVGGKLLSASCDMVRESSHFPREMAAWERGWYAVNVALSDIASMGARPLGLLLSLGLPGETTVEHLRGVASGISDACSYQGTRVVGGDTKAQEELTLAMTALGESEKVMRRSGALEGELICVTGSIGDAAAGFYALTRGLEAGNKKELLRRAFRPVARVREGLKIAQYSRCCMDISDGLAFSLHEIARQSHRGFEVYMDRIPRSGAVKEVAALSGVEEGEILFHKGGEFELLFTLSEEHLEELEKSLPKLITPIGRVTTRKKRLLAQGESLELPARGHESF